MNDEETAGNQTTLPDAFLASIVELLPARIFAKDRFGRYIFANRAFAATTRVSTPERLVGLSPREALDHQRALRAEDEDRRLLRTREPILEQENLDGIGSEGPRWTLVSKVPVTNPAGEIEGMVGIAFDIHRRKIAEQRLRELSEQLAARNRQLEEGLELARRIHRFLCAPQQPRKESGKGLEIESIVHQSEELGGDLVKVERKDNGDSLILLCDVMGHGIQAALVSALLSGLFDRVVEETCDPGQTLTRLNNRFVEALSGSDDLVYATAVCAHHESRTNTIAWASAGHPDPLVFKRSTNAIFSIDKGPDQGQGALGLFADSVYKSDNFALDQGDRALLFSDGFTEARDGNGRELGPEGLAKMLESICRSKTAPKLQELFDRMKMYSPRFPTDDASAVLFINL